jgi:4-amino-4-deoxy-L-arabinose transferase-like glycosyltransferase
VTAAERRLAASISPSTVRRWAVPTAPTARLVPWARANWGVIAVFLTFAAAAMIVPTMAPVATTDDWAYTRSAQILLEEGRLTVFPVVAATAVFQIVWGAIFGLVFEPTFGVFRLSTVVITALGAAALYALCRDLGVSRGRGALGVATLLFNPLVFVLAFTFMTDNHFMALLAIATWLYAKALREAPLIADAVDHDESLVPEPPATRASPLQRVSAIDGRWIVAGSVVAGLAFLARQQGALIVPAVFVFLLATRRLRFDRASLVLLIWLVAPMALAVGGYFLWLRFGNDVPRVQSQFLREILADGWGGAWWLLRRLTVVELVYLGVFTLPLMAAAVPFLKRLTEGIPRRGWIVFAAWQAVLLVGVTAFWARGAYMPYIAQFFGSGGLGPPDVLGSRPILLGPDIRAVLTIACLVASLLLALTAARAMGAPPSLARSRAGIVLAVGLGQVVGVMPPSFHYIGWASGSLDRYLLPLVPLAIALALWALRDVRLALPLGWVVAAALAVFAVAGTRDYLVYMRAVWSLGEEAVAAGVPLDRLDAGSGWDGYHLYERGLETPIRSRTPKGGPWWVYFYAPATDSAYVVSGKPLRNHFVVARRPYSSWLQTKPTNLYLLRRFGEPWPPRAEPKPIVVSPGPGGLVTVPLVVAEQEGQGVEKSWGRWAAAPTAAADTAPAAGSAVDDE